MFAFHYNSRPLVVVDMRVNFHAKVFGQRMTHGVGLHRGYCGFSDCFAWACVVASSQEAKVAHRERSH